MKWWKQTKATKTENPISVLTDKLFTLDNNSYSFVELLKKIQNSKIHKSNNQDAVTSLIDLALKWSKFLQEMSSPLIATRVSGTKVFREYTINETNGSSLKIFDETFFNDVLYYSKKDYFEMENFIVPIILKLNYITVDQRIVNMLINYYSKNVSSRAWREIKIYNLELSLFNIEHGLKNIDKGQGLRAGYGHGSEIIANMHTVTVGGLGAIIGFIRKYYKGEDDVNELITKLGLDLIHKKFLNDKIIKSANNISLNIVKDKMISRINQNVIKSYSSKNQGIINVLNWVNKTFNDGNSANDVDSQTKRYKTVLSTLEGLHEHCDFKKRAPSKNLVQAVINFSLLHSTYNKGGTFGFGNDGNSFENFIFHPFIIKVLQFNYVDEKLVKKLVSQGTNSGLLVLSVMKCKTKDKHVHNLIKNIIYNLNVRKKLLSEKKLSGLARIIHKNLTWENDPLMGIFWATERYRKTIYKNKIKTVAYITKSCDKLLVEINLKNGKKDLVVFG